MANKEIHASSERETKIGNTTYVVRSFCSLSRDEIKAKVVRLIKNAAAQSKD